MRADLDSADELLRIMESEGFDATPEADELRARLAAAGRWPRRVDAVDWETRAWDALKGLFGRRPAPGA